MKKSVPHILLLAILNCFCLIAFSQTFVPGNTYYDSTGFVEYRAGNIPIILSAPHGGDLEPNTIPDRNCVNCVIIKDTWTKNIAEGMDGAFYKQTGCYPHVIINLLHRKKFDANRDIGDAANGNPTVEKAWYGYHQFIDSAKAKIIKDFGRGLFLDIHGQGHPIQRIELGYQLSESQLQLSDSILNTASYIKKSSVRTLAGDNIKGIPHAELVRGKNSFGELLYKKGFPSVPSQSDPFPKENELFFEGGYNTQRHGSRNDNGKIDAIQLELNYDVRFDATLREKLIDSLTKTSIEYIGLYYYDRFGPNFCNVILDISETESFNSSNIKIYPNPATKYFDLISELNEIEVAIYNGLGQRVLSEIYKGNKIGIDFLPAGYYFVQFRKGSDILGYTKLIKN